LVHSLYRVSKEIRGQFPKIDQFISNSMIIFLKARVPRMDTFNLIESSIPSPPQPMVTRWGTWFTTALYDYEYFLIIKAIINLFDIKYATSIAKCHKLLSEGTLQNNLMYIKAKLSSFQLS